MRKQIEDSMSIVKNLEVTVSEVKANTFHFTCTVPGRIVQENRVSGIFVSDSEWLDWVVIIERGGKVIERHMKNTPLMRRIDEALDLELKKFAESVTKDPGEEFVDIDVEGKPNPEQLAHVNVGTLDMPEFLRR